MGGAPAYPRDLIGYGSTPPHPRWPGGARLALSFVLNYEEGAENCVLHGDPGSETFLSEIVGAQSFPMRHLSMESLYEYGARAGVWRILRLFAERHLPLTIYGVAMALARHADLTRRLVAAGHEIACHGLRWISYQLVDPLTERAHMAEAVRIIRTLTGSAPLGWYTGRDSPQTRRLLIEHGGFLYDSDSYADDLPYWVKVEVDEGAAAATVGATGATAGATAPAAPQQRCVPHLVVPYTLDTNDMRFVAVQGFNSGTQYFDYLKDAFDVLYQEGDPAGLDQPKMLSIGLHCRLVGRPARLAALARFLDHVAAHPAVWICRRVDIARHWIATHPAPA
jgi:peptidoglycan/xylan/chitin deacetylase (PgdA/CDA1 family)